MSQSQKKVLLAEVDAVSLKNHKTLLHIMQLQVDIVETGAEAIMQFKANVYALVILADDLPDLWGNALSKRLRKIEKIQNRVRTPIILLSIYADSLAEKSEGDVDAYLDKKIHPIRLETLITEQLNKMNIK